MPLFITATCEFSRFDDPSRISAGEMVINNINGGGVALMTTTRLSYSNHNDNLNRSIYKVIFEKTANKYPTLGEILSFAKTDNGSNRYIRNFALLGDPAMRLEYPEYNVVTDSINGHDVNAIIDTLSAQSFVTIKGHISDMSNNLDSNFNGIVYPTVYDKPSKYTTLATNPTSNTPAEFSLQKNILYKGKANVVNGKFSFSFYVPKDINYAFDYGKISYYAENGEIDANGYFEGFYIGGSDNSINNDDIGPEIELFINDTNFVSGGIANENPVLLAHVFDFSGINTMGIGIGHDITAILDNSDEVIILNDYYEADENSYQNGKVIFPFFNIENGEHSLNFKIWDVFNNSSTATISFIVEDSHQAVIRKLFNYPNPFTDYTDFIFQHNQSCTPMEIIIDIYKIDGQHVCRLEKEQQILGFSSDPIRWYGITSDGRPVENGVYIYKVSITTCDGVKDYKSNKLVIIK
jgi:hypothetical protein